MTLLKRFDFEKFDVTLCKMWRITSIQLVGDMIWKQIIDVIISEIVNYSGKKMKWNEKRMKNDGNDWENLNENESEREVISNSIRVWLNSDMSVPSNLRVRSLGLWGFIWAE